MVLSRDILVCDKNASKEGKVTFRSRGSKQNKQDQNSVNTFEYVRTYQPTPHRCHQDNTIMS